MPVTERQVEVAAAVEAQRGPARRAVEELLAAHPDVVDAPDGLRRAADLLDRQERLFPRPSVADLQAQVERVSAERDAARENFLNARDRRDALETEVERLREALAEERRQHQCDCTAAARRELRIEGERDEARGEAARLRDALAAEQRAARELSDKLAALSLQVHVAGGGK